MPPRLADINVDLRDQHTATDFARYVACFANTRNVEGAAALFTKQFPHALNVDVVRRSVELSRKATTAVGTTTDPAWAGPLAPGSPLVQAFLQIIKPREVLSQLVGTLRVPTGTPIPIYSRKAAPANLWRGQNTPTPIGAFTFTAATLARTKLALITVVTKELLTFGVAGTELALRDILASQIIDATNAALIDPANVAVPDVNPGSVTSAGTLVTTANDAAKDAAAVLAALVVARPNVTDPTLIMNAAAAAALIPTDAHHDLQLNGGRALGATVIVTGAAGKTIAALDPAALLVSDTGLEMDMSEEAVISMSDAPTTPDATTVQTPLWTQNFVAFKCARYLSWKLTDATACQYATRA